MGQNAWRDGMEMDVHSLHPLASQDTNKDLMKCPPRAMSAFYSEFIKEWKFYVEWNPHLYLDVSTGVDFVNSVSGGSARFSVQIVTLDKHCVVTEASHPHISLTFTLQLDSFTNVKPGREEREK